MITNKQTNLIRQQQKKNQTIHTQKKRPMFRIN
jgi:hypothetical protein